MGTDERSTMTPALHTYLTSLSEKGRDRLARESRDALRLAWPHRNSLRGRTVIKSNVTMLRNLRAL
jgi:hypothetical protein